MRNLEAIITFLVLTMFGYFFGELAYAKPKANEVLKGMFIPNLRGSGETCIYISLLGVFLHCKPLSLFCFVNSIQ